MRGPVWNFVQHLLEMVVAMFVGMFALGMPADMLFEAVGATALTEQLVPRTLLMATFMTVGMSAWMRVRGCSWPAVRDMALAMYLPFVAMYPFHWAGWVSATAVMVVGHVVMVPAMVGAMLLRRTEYTTCVGNQSRRSALSPS